MRSGGPIDSVIVRMKHRKKVKSPLVIPAAIAVTVIAGTLGAVSCGGDVVATTTDGGATGGSTSSSSGGNGGFIA